VVDGPRCEKCWAVKTHFGVPLCGYCQSRLTSVHAHVALAQKGPLTQEQRDWLWQWFLKTRYFAFHRRMSRGRAKKLLAAMEVSNV